MDRVQIAVTTTIQQLLHRRRITTASAQRRPRAATRVLPPTGLVIAYTRVLRDLSDSMDHAILEVLGDKGLLRADAVEAHVVADLETALQRIWGRRNLVGALDHIAVSVADRSGREFRQQVAKALGVRIIGDPQFDEMFQRFRRENLALIKSLADDKVDRVKKVLDETPGGDRVEVIRKNIMEVTGATRSRASLIARDQVLKLNSDVTRERHEAAGITEYVWSTSRDERVRRFHKDLDGKRFKYAEPPVISKDGRRENPGGDYQCRCTAIPVLPE
jgi:SPP1 gp7 family putative phage head morphogenesis protein